MSGYKEKLIQWAVNHPGGLWADNEGAAAARKWLSANAPEELSALYWNESDEIRRGIDRRFVPEDAKEKEMEMGVSDAMNDFGNKMYNVVDTATAFMPGPVGTLNWLAHTGVDAATGQHGKIATDLALAAGLYAGGKVLSGALEQIAPRVKSAVGHKLGMIDDINQYINEGNEFRIVGEPAIRDAKNSGLIRAKQGWHHDSAEAVAKAYPEYLKDIPDWQYKTSGEVFDILSSRGAFDNLSEKEKFLARMNFRDSSNHGGTVHYFNGMTYPNYHVNKNDFVIMTPHQNRFVPGHGGVKYDRPFKENVASATLLTNPDGSVRNASISTKGSSFWEFSPFWDMWVKHKFAEGGPTDIEGVPADSEGVNALKMDMPLPKLTPVSGYLNEMAAKRAQSEYPDSIASTMIKYIPQEDTPQLFLRKWADGRMQKQLGVIPDHINWAPMSNPQARGLNRWDREYVDDFLNQRRLSAESLRERVDEGMTTPIFSLDRVKDIIMPDDTLGAYSRARNSIFLKDTSDVDSAIHELTHASQTFGDGVPNDSLFGGYPIIPEHDYDPYLDLSKEIVARLMQVRYRNNLDPNRIYTEEDILKMREDPNFKDNDIVNRYPIWFTTRLFNQTFANGGLLRNYQDGGKRKGFIKPGTEVSTFEDKPEPVEIKDSVYKGMSYEDVSKYTGAKKLIDETALEAGVPADKIAEYWNEGRLLPMMEGRYPRIFRNGLYYKDEHGNLVFYQGAKKPNTSKTSISRISNDAVRISSDVQETTRNRQIYGLDEDFTLPNLKYGIQFLPETGIVDLGNGSYTTYNALDSLAKYGVMEKLTPEEYLGLPWRETQLGRYIGAYAPHGMPQSMRAYYNMNYFNNYGFIPAENLVNDWAYNRKDAKGESVHSKTDMPPLQHAFRYFKSGKYNPGEPGHTDYVLQSGRNILSNPGIQEWMAQSKYVDHGYEDGGAVQYAGSQTSSKSVSPVPQDSLDVSSYTKGVNMNNVATVYEKLKEQGWYLDASGKLVKQKK